MTGVDSFHGFSELILLTPVYKEELDQKEVARLRVTLLHNSKRKHAFFGPENMDYSCIEAKFPQSEIYKFPDRFFHSTQTYSELLVDISFYRTFEKYYAILITQPDSIVINEIPSELVRRYDYIGGSWEKPFSIFSIKQRLIITKSRTFRKISHQVWIGNGGLSLRNVGATIDVLQKFFKNQSRFASLKLNRGLNEDVVISFLMHKYFKRVPMRDAANRIFLEVEARNLSEFKTEIGFHGLAIYNPGLEEKILNRYT